jgi:glycerophosphoryl diester phosphodiesterase
VNYQDIKNLVLDIPKAKYQDFVNNYLCTFNEYLDVCQKYNKIPIVELKQPNLTKTQLINLIKIITQKKMLYKTSFISFEYDLLNLLKLIEPKIITYDLIDTKFTRNGLGKTGIKHAINLKHNISVRHFLATKSLIKIAHDNNVLISI